MNFMEEATARAMISGQREVIAKQSALLAQMAAALEEVQKQFDCPARNTNRGRAYREGVAISMDVREEVRAAVAAYAASSPDPQWQRVPEGCVVVPLEPTEEMVAAGFAVHPCAPGKSLVTDCYITMIKRARGKG